MGVVTSALATTVFLLDLGLIAALIVFLARKMGKELEFLEPADGFISDRKYYIVLTVASIATAGSLYLSNVLGWTPCRLCWFQRIFMYPIVVLSASAIYLRKDDLKDYVMPLALIGIPIALYHSIIQRIEQFHSAGCSIMEVSCETQYTFHYGYITVPVMALTAFLAIAVILWRYD
ncbi:MAG: disulfide bond formation protein B [Candidatus Nanohaloarchaea archaeon]